ncbi:hypothetical protein BDQ17DRAFT_1380993, partial [Cyathus striatus]
IPHSPPDLASVLLRFVLFPFPFLLLLGLQLTLRLFLPLLYTSWIILHIKRDNPTLGIKRPRLQHLDYFPGGSLNGIGKNNTCSTLCIAEFVNFAKMGKREYKSIYL